MTMLAVMYVYHNTRCGVRWLYRRPICAHIVSICPVVDPEDHCWQGNGERIPYCRVWWGHFGIINQKTVWFREISFCCVLLGWCLHVIDFHGGEIASTALKFLPGTVNGPLLPITRLDVQCGPAIFSSNTRKHSIVRLDVQNMSYFHFYICDAQ